MVVDGDLNFVIRPFTESQAGDFSTFNLVISFYFSYNYLILTYKLS